VRGKRSKLGEGERELQDYYVRSGLLHSELLRSGLLCSGQLRSASLSDIEEVAVIEII
jgi:hypothetical protein